MRSGMVEMWGTIDSYRLVIVLFLRVIMIALRLPCPRSCLLSSWPSSTTALPRTHITPSQPHAKLLPPESGPCIRLDPRSGSCEDGPVLCLVKASR